MLVYAAFMPIGWRCVSIGRFMVGRRLGTAMRIYFTLLDAAVPGLKGPPRWMSGDPLKQVSAYQVASYGGCMTTYAWPVIILTSDSAPTGNLLPDTITNKTSKINCLTFPVTIQDFWPPTAAHPGVCSGETCIVTLFGAYRNLCKWLLIPKIL